MKEKFPVTTLCYIEKEDSYLMLHRVTKKNDVNKDKWIGVGGHLEEGESPEECLLREVKEETGLTLHSWKFRALITFTQKGYGTEYMCLFTSDDFSGELKECDEGVLTWVPVREIPKLNLWQGDLLFHKLLLDGVPFFSLKLTYEGDELKEALLNGTEIPCGLCKDIAGCIDFDSNKIV